MQASRARRDGSARQEVVCHLDQPLSRIVEGISVVHAECGRCDHRYGLHEISAVIRLLMSLAAMGSHLPAALRCVLVIVCLSGRVRAFTCRRAREA